MTGYLNWIVLNDGVAEKVSHVDASEEAAAIDRVLVPIVNGQTGKPRGMDSGYSVTGQISGKYALIRLFDEQAPLADIGVCMHSRAAPRLWSQLLSGVDSAELPDLEIPSAPWCAVICYGPESVMPAWFDSWSKTIGVALVEREGW